MGYKAKVGVFF